MVHGVCHGQPRSRLPPMFTRHVIRLHSTQRVRSSTEFTPRFGKVLVSAAALIATGASALWYFANGQNHVPQLTELPSAHQISRSSLSERDVTTILSQEACSVAPHDGSGVKRYDVTRIAANTPCEDRFVHGQLARFGNDGRPWSAWGIFDGHSGWQTAELLSQQLVPFVRKNLDKVASHNDMSSVQRAVMKAFVDFDKAILSTALETAHSHAPLQEKIKTLAPAYAGSCALLSLFNPSNRTLHVACTGDARAVLGKRAANGKWEAIPLSIDQNGSNADEVSRLREEHPGEDGLVANGRVLGLMTSRAFGDVQWKFPAATLSEFAKLYRTPAPLTPHYPVLTPPYITAEPVVTMTKLPPNESFLILASDGLWFSMSDQDAVNAVGYWLDRGIATEKPSSMHDGLNFSSSGVPWKYADECVTVEDDNAAVHLVRNALGGRNRELVAARLAYWPPRRIRDDITVQVVFFKSS
ncbi:hypothetical protein FH972_024019 [Carpinus fangiana]|uniref:PPM-type phosphatase domain-containing protein n=1 Tax=Carpinus fangiana TaxID=176857 RepID=A0A5N6KX47_9ROSI|nr:hypothetical protein FH972_024019 [Carpinus fangiana]